MLSHYRTLLGLGVVLVLIGAVVFLVPRIRWWQDRVQQASNRPDANDDGHEGAHGHDHAGHDDSSSLELSERALRNVGFQPLKIELQQFVKTTAVPAMVVERPGRSQLDVTAPMTGIITKVYVIEGEAVAPGTPLFDLRLTHEELVESQRTYLQSAQELDVVKRELARLKSIGEGVIAGKRVLEREYEKQKIEAGLLAQREGLLLHGLSEDQVNNILEKRTLFKKLTVVAPAGAADCTETGSRHLLVVQSLKVKPGQQVTAGESMCILGDHCRLYIEGKAFEEDAERLNRAAVKNYSVSAVLMSGEGKQDTEGDLQILYVADRIEPVSRALHFYVDLPNKVIRDQKKNGHWFIGWKYKPGQRFEVKIPVKRLEEQIVLPVDAVVEEGAETFVFQRNGDHFDRIEVAVEDRDRDHVLIAKDGSLFPGDVIAAKGAYQMHLAMKNKAGGGIDPHAGHSH